ncbi:MAG: membrane protease subunit [bacterium]
MSIFYNKKEEDYKWGWVALASGGLIILITAALMIISPIYGVWSSKKAGEAELAKAKYAEYTARIKAKAKEEAAGYLAQAEIERAKGVALSVEIVGTALNKNPGYLTYKWIQNISKDKNDQVIYVPSKGGLPILEAGRLLNKTK